MRTSNPQLSGNLVRVGVLIGLLIPLLAISGPAFAESNSGTRTVKRTKTVVGHRKVRSSKHSSKRSSKRSGRSSSSSSSGDSIGSQILGGIIVGLIDAMVDGGDSESDSDESEEWSSEDSVESDPIIITEFGASFTQLAPRGPEFEPAMSSYIGLGFAAPGAILDLGVGFDLPFESTTAESANTELKHLQIGASFRFGPEWELVRPYLKLGMAGYYNREWGAEDVAGVAFNTGVGLNFNLGSVEIGAVYGLDLLTVIVEQPDQEEDKLSPIGTRQQIGLQTVFRF